MEMDCHRIIMTNVRRHTASTPCCLVEKMLPHTSLICAWACYHDNMTTFAAENDFTRELRRRVDGYFTSNGLATTATPAMYAKIVFWVAFTYGMYAFLTLHPVGRTLWSIPLWSLTGIGFSCIGFNVSHDAIHGSTSNHKGLNFLLSCTFDAMGVSSDVWRMQHNQLHHTYTNIAGLDMDIDPGAWMRFQPRAPRMWWQRFQVIYSWAFYSLVSLLFVFHKDFYMASIKNPKTGKRFGAKAWAGIIAGKISHGVLFMGIPYLAGFTMQQWLVAYFSLHLTAGLALAVVFQLAHVVERVSFATRAPVMSMPFLQHQLYTTANFGTGPVATFFFGGLNHQVEHHLFPRTCHIHYPALAPIVRGCCEEFGVPYIHNGTTLQALWSHCKVLHRLGNSDDAPLLEEVVTHTHVTSSPTPIAA
jgi:linoleoyl-CoA desaturase